MNYPDEQRAPWALVKAAELLREQLGQAEYAQQLLTHARQRYPGNQWVK